MLLPMACSNGQRLLSVQELQQLLKACSVIAALGLSWRVAKIALTSEMWRSRAVHVLLNVDV